MTVEVPVTGEEVRVEEFEQEMDAEFAAAKAVVDAQILEVQADITALQGAVTLSLKWTTPVAVVATTNITLSGEQTIDGVLTSNSRVAVTGHADPTKNGVWVSAAGVWSRAADMNADDEIHAKAVFVNGGSSFGASGWTFIVDDPGTFVLGTDDIAAVQVSDAGALRDYVDAQVAPKANAADLGTAAAKATEFFATAANVGSFVSAIIDDAVSIGALSAVRSDGTIILNTAALTGASALAQLYGINGNPSEAKVRADGSIISVSIGAEIRYGMVGASGLQYALKTDKGGTPRVHMFPADGSGLGAPIPIADPVVSFSQTDFELSIVTRPDNGDPSGYAGAGRETWTLDAAGLRRVGVAWVGSPILTLGDSTTAGTGASSVATRWTTIMSASLGRSIVNRGEGGAPPIGTGKATPPITTQIAALTAAERDCLVILRLGAMEDDGPTGWVQAAQYALDQLPMTGGVNRRGYRLVLCPPDMQNIGTERRQLGDGTGTDPNGDSNAGGVRASGAATVEFDGVSYSVTLADEFQGEEGCVRKWIAANVPAQNFLDLHTQLLESVLPADTDKRASAEAVVDWIVANAPAAWSDITDEMAAQSTPITEGDVTAADLLALARGYFPPSLMADGIHRADAGHAAEAAIIEAFITEKLL